MDIYGPIFDNATGIVLHLTRAAAFLSVVPTFGSQASSKMLRLILAISLGSVMWATSDAQVETPGSMVELGFLTAREGAIGLLAGFAIRTTTVVLGVAGEVIAHEMGFSMSRVLNPETGAQVTPMAQLFEIMGLLLIFQLNLHHEMLRIIQGTYELVPIGTGFDYELVYQRASDMVAQALDFGLQYAIPVFGVLILLTVTLMILARAVQNINLMEFAFGLRILLAFVSAIYFLIEGAPFLERVFDKILLDAHDLFTPAV